MHPRAKLSPADAAFTAQFLKTIHSFGPPAVPTLKVLDRLFSSDLGAIIFPCTEHEASNYGKFLRDLLSLAKTWYDSPEAFAKTGLGKDKRGRYLPGMRFKQTKEAWDRNEEADMLSHDNLTKVVKKWTGQISLVS